MDIYATIRYTKRTQIGIGQGMNSVVFLADDPHLMREIVVKEIDRATLSGTWDDYHKEAQAMFAARHRNVVPIHYACLTASHLALAMPYYAKGSLADRIKGGPLPTAEAFRIAQAMLTGLGQVHTTGQVHLDLKPSNVLF